jgi:hypothetical protein
MASPQFRIGYAAALAGPYTFAAFDAAAAIPANYYCKVGLQSLAGVNSISVTLPTADPVTLAAGLPAVTVDQATKTATWRHPNATGRSINVCVIVNGGVDGNGATDATLTRSLQSYSATEAGLVAGVVGETTEFHRTYGHTQKINALMASAQPASFRVIEGVVTTTAGTPTKSVCTMTLPTGVGVVLATANVQGEDTVPNGCAYIEVAAFKYSSIAGAFVQIGATQELFAQHDAAWTHPAFTVAGSTVTLDVTGSGAVDTKFNAQLELRILSV